MTFFAPSRFLLVAAAASLLACRAETSTPPPPSGGGTWSKAASLPGPRFEAKAVALDGRVYFVGGITGITSDQQSARESNLVDIYDPVANTWASGPVLPADAPKHHLAITVFADHIYVLGGFTGIIGGADPAGVFTPNAGTFVLEGSAWRRLADQPFARGSASAEVIDGIIYVAGGGIAEPDARTDLYAYDPVHDQWSERAPLPTAREHVASCAIDGKLIVVGGWAGLDKHVVGAVESYDPTTNAWTRLPDMPTARGGLGAAVLHGLCFVVGGEDWVSAGAGTFPNVEALDVAHGSWTTYAPMPLARHGLGITVLDNRLYAVGGGPSRGNSYTDEVDVFQSQ